MTIHAAKGLEFDTVIVPFLHRVSPDSNRDLVMFAVRAVQDEERAHAEIYDYGVKIDCTKEAGETEYAKVRCLELERDGEEIRRLLYVAATRARERCYLTFAGEGQPPARSMLGQAAGLESVKICDMKDWVNGAGKAVTKGKCGSVLEVDGHATESSRGRRRVGNFESLRKHLEDVNRLGARRSTRVPASDRDRAADRAAVGEVVHEEMVATLDAWHPDGMKGRLKDETWRRRCERRLKEKGWRGTGGVVDEGVDEVGRHLTSVCRDRRVFGKLAELMTGRSEWSLEFEKEFQSAEELCEGDLAGRVKRLDLVIWNEKRKSCLIVDFKSGVRRKEHEDQVTCYSKFVRNAYPGYSIGTALYYTSTAELVEVSGMAVVELVFGSMLPE